MTLSQATRWRNRIGRVGTCCCLLFAFAALDGLISQFRQPLNQFELLPGETVGVNGGLPTEVKDPGELVVDTSSPDMRIVVEAIHSGFWLGGNMWRGTLEVRPTTAPGQLVAVVRLKDKPAEKALAAFVVNVHESRESVRKAAKSLIRQYLDLPPWLVFAVSFLSAALAFGGVYRLTEKRDALLAAEGRAELYRIAKRDDCYEVAFGLGKEHGIAAGDELSLMAGDGEPIGTVRVTHVFDRDSAGEVDLSCDVRPGCTVAKPGMPRIRVV